MPSEHQFILRTADGAEHGPVDQRTLETWAKSGRITRECEVRNALIHRWSPATDVAFLKPIIEAREAAEDTGPSKLDIIKQKLTKSGVADMRLPGLAAGQRVMFTPGTVPLRILAGLIDLAIVLAYGAVIYGLAGAVVRSELFSPAEAFEIGFGVFYAGVLLFFAWTIGFHAQTPGQRFWGLMVVRKEGEQVFLGRAFVLALGTCLLGWTSPFVVFVLPPRRGIAELISGTRVVRTRVMHDGG
ncbi:MAG: RDD family protein [Kiritimatiellaeota bacterium]|nr:RDD family protein [Kiritimatiellota bacterium]